MKIIYKLHLIVVTLLSLISCATNDTLQSEKASATRQILGMPDGISNINGKGFVTTECVVASSSFSIDRKEALSKAQISLAQQIKSKVSAMDKIQMEKNGDKVSDRFSSNSEVIVDDYVHNAKIQQQDYVNMRGQDNLCIQIAIVEADKAPIFNKVIESAGVNINELEKKNLYAAFME